MAHKKFINMGIGTIIIYQVMLQTLFPHFVTPLKCPPGTFLYTIVHKAEQFCIECPDGTFVPYNNHQQTACIPCEKIKDTELENLISPCNKTHDAVIHCGDGYYRDLASNEPVSGKCRKCTECSQFTGRPCGTYRDAVCCWDENYDVIPNHHGALVCRERPWFCRRGEYFDTKTFLCLTCPEKTFMPVDHHIQPECWKCREYDKYDSYRPLHSVIIQPCNKTHAPVIRCEDGYFMKPNMGYRDMSLGCSPCTVCSTTNAQYEGRECGNMEDTVCCHQANMTVVDTPKGPVCCPGANMTVVNTRDGPVCKAPLQNPVRVCDEGHCPHQSRRKRSIDCVPCPPSTDVDHSANTVARPGDAEQSKRIDPVAKETFLNDDQSSNDGSIAVFIIIGIVIGLALSLVCYLIYGNRNRWLRWLRNRKRPRYPTDAQPEHQDVGESEPLAKTNIKFEKHTIPRRRQAEVFSMESKEQRNRFNGSSEPLAANDDQGREQCCGNEGALNSKRESCKNVDKHKSLICAKTFRYENLPEGLRGDNKMAYIKAVCDLTVRLKVNHTSIARPDNYPCHELRGFAGAGMKRFGTGLVFQVTKKFDEDNKDNPCPCRSCSVDQVDAKGKWAEFVVVTAAQVVYDDLECSQMSCKLWFDHDEDFVKAPSLYGREVVDKTNNNKDFRKMYCITHDPKVSKELEEKIAILDSFRERFSNMVSETEVDESKFAVLISHQHGLNKNISVGNATMKMDDEIQKWSYDVLTCPGSCGAPVCILGKSQGSSCLTTIHSMENESTGFYL